MARVKKLDWGALEKRIPARWRPDPHKRGKVIPAKKVYRRRARNQARHQSESAS